MIAKNVRLASTALAAVGVSLLGAFFACSNPSAPPPVADCSTAADCPGSGDRCRTGDCVDGKCADRFADAGTPAEGQDAGDCREFRCNGEGSAVSVPLDSDVPDDGNPCTRDLCAAGAPSHAN